MEKEIVRATFDLNSVEGQMKLFNAKNGAGVSLKDLENGYIIEGIDVLQYEEEVTTYGGEQQAIVTVIFGKDGTQYAGISESVAKAGQNLIDFIQNTGMEEFKVRVVKQRSSRGNEFLNLQIVG